MQPTWAGFSPLTMRSTYEAKRPPDSVADFVTGVRPAYSPALAWPGLNPRHLLRSRMNLRTCHQYIRWCRAAGAGVGQAPQMLALRQQADRFRARSAGAAGDARRAIDGVAAVESIQMRWNAAAGLAVVLVLCGCQSGTQLPPTPVIGATCQHFRAAVFS